MFEHFFVVPHYYEALDKAFALNSIKNEEIFVEYCKEKFKKVQQNLKVFLRLVSGSFFSHRCPPTILPFTLWRLAEPTFPPEHRLSPRPHPQQPTKPPRKNHPSTKNMQDYPKPQCLIPHSLQRNPPLPNSPVYWKCLLLTRKARRLGW